MLAALSNLHCVGYFDDNRSEHLEHALIFGRRALELDPEEPWANCAVGLSLTFLHRLEEVGHYLDRAIPLSPNQVSFLNAIDWFW